MQQIKKTKFSLFDQYLLIPIVLLVFFAAFFLVYEDIKDRTIKEFNNEQLVLARTASQAITGFFDESEANLTFLTQMESIIDFDDTGKEMMHRFYENHRSIMAGLTRVDSVGNIIHTYPIDSSVIGNNIAYQKHVSQILETHEPVISDVFKAVQGYYAIAMHIPIFNKDTYVGSLAMLIPIDALGKQYLANIEIRGTGNVWLLSENGIEIYCPIEGHTGQNLFHISNENKLTLDLLKEIKTSKSGTVKGVHEESNSKNKKSFHEKYITFYRTSLENTYWTILISYHEKDIYKELNRLRNRLIIVFSLLLVAILFYFYSLAKVRNVLREAAKRRQAEKTLRQSEERFRNLFENSAVGNTITFIDDRIKTNRAFKEMLGYTAAEFKFANWQEITHPVDVELSRQVIDSLLNGEYSTREFEKRYLHKNGKTVLTEVRTTLQNDEFGNPLYFINTIIDITERKHQEYLLKEKNEEIETQNEEYKQINIELQKAIAKAEENDRLKTAFLQNMNHEIRTPLNAIAGFTQLLSRGDITDEERTSFGSIIENSSAQLVSIINDVLSIASLETKQETLAIEKVNINEVLTDLHAIFKPHADAKNVALGLHTQLSKEQSEIYTDKTKVTQILTNFLSNALKFTHEGHISFGYQLKDADKKPVLEFFIEDTGIGIDSENIEKIFERFRQADLSISYKYGGTGLGLSISKGLVDLLGGTIRVSSEPGKGSTFYFTLPYQIKNEN
ncbi:MAG: ATP-binding protein [Salinivirgaceae bacterium]